MSDTKRPRLDHGETFEHRGYTFRVEYPRDEDHGEPWKECDGHGIISEWTRRDKAPSERTLCVDHGSKRFYDVQASIKLARKDGWGCKHSKFEKDPESGKDRFVSGHATAGELAACAVERDYDYLRRWCNDDWCYVGVVVRQIEYDEETGDELKTGMIESVWGIESDAHDYLTETAYELADEIVGRLEIDDPVAAGSVILSEN